MTDYNETFKAEIVDTYTTPDEENLSAVAWYIMESSRRKMVLRREFIGDSETLRT